MPRDLDLVLLGSTGFTGRLVAEYLALHAPASLRIGLAGRALPRLEALRAGLPPAAHAWPLLEVDAQREADVQRLAAAARVVCTNAGPYARYGLPLMAACAAAGTHACDITGETAFMRDSIDRCDRSARASGARLVHACGFDSIPSDLGVQLLHGTLGPMRRATLVVESLRGGPSGGTVATLLASLDEARGSRERRRVMGDPYGLSPDRAAEPDLGRQRDLATVRYDDFVGGWTSPFVMAPVNTRVVRRSSALQGHAYGRAFRYAEVSGGRPGVRGLLRAVQGTAVLGGLLAALANPLTRGLVLKRLPAPGQGPSEAQRRAGRVRMRLHGEAEDGRRATVLIAGQGDPGCAFTSVLMAESALCLALDEGSLPERAGVLTPATALGGVLLARLRAAGVTLAVQAV